MNRLLFGLMVLAVFAQTPASAKALPDGGVTAAEVAAVLQAAGIASETSTDSDGDPKLKATIERIEFYVVFYDCKKGPRCIGMQFSAGFDLTNGFTLVQINQWNRKYRFGRAYLDDENDPIIQMDADYEHGGTTEAIANDLEVWRTLMQEFPKFIGFKPQ